MRSLSKTLLLLVFLFFCGRNARAGESEERVLWELWKLHGLESNHVAVAAGCRKAEKDLGASPLAAVPRGLLAWHLLKTGSTSNAEVAATAMLTPGASPVEQAAAEMAKRWLTRFDRERVRAALREVFKRDIRYPETLDAVGKLPPELRPPMQDRWGRAWKYGPAALPHIKGVQNSSFGIESPVLGPDSDLAAFGRQPYPEAPGLKPVAVSTEGARTVTFETTDARRDRVVLGEGTAHKNVTLAYIGDRILVLSDGDHWFVIARPGT